MTLTPRQRYQIAAETGVDPKTVKRIYEGLPVRDASRDRVFEAARKLSLPLPPDPGPDPDIEKK